MQQIGQNGKYRIAVAVCTLIAGFIPSVCLGGETFSSLSQTENCEVFCTACDSDGYLWLGTSSGALRFDGYRVKTYSYNASDSLSLVNNIVNSILADGNTILMGTDRGLSIYDKGSDRFTNERRFGGMHIKAMLADGQRLYVGTTSGLYVWDRECDTIERLQGLPSDHISCLALLGGKIYAGAYKHIYEIDRDNPASAAIIHSLPGLSSSTLVLAIELGRESGELLVGAENGLWRYDPESGRMKGRIIDGVPVKSFHYHKDRLWAGSDNGLFLVSGKGVEEEYHHRVSDSSSLPNDVIWCINCDLNGNIIIGTDHGAAVVETEPHFRFTAVNNLAEGDAGLDVGVMLDDGRGSLWLGGRNGLIRSGIDNAGFRNSSTRNSGSANYGSTNGERFYADRGRTDKRLPHNKIRALSSDGRHLWAATDGGLGFYDYATGKWGSCDIVERQGRFSSKWMYSVCSDDQGRLWAGTYDGGIFVIDKKKIRNGEALCDLHFSTGSKPAISGNIIRHTVFCNGKIVTDCDNIIDIIDYRQNSIRHLPLPNGEYVTCMECLSGNIYVGTDKGLYRLDGEALLRLAPEQLQITAICLRDNQLAVCSGNSLFSLKDGRLEEEGSADSMLMSMETYNGRLYLGTIDGILTEEQKSVREAGKIAVTDFRINDSYAERAMWAEGKVRLPHSCNTFGIEFSDFVYGNAKSRFCWRLKGFDDKWRTEEEGSNTADFLNMPAGKYVFEVAHASADGSPAGEVCRIDISVKPVWYASVWAYIIYFLLFVALAAWVLYYLRMKQQLEIEKIERRNAIEAADDKTRFINNITNEFKGELGTVMTFVDRMSMTESDSLKSSPLRNAMKSAEKMHLLLEKMSEFNSGEQDSLFIPSPVVLEDFSREIWDEFRDRFTEKGIYSRFVADKIGYIFLADRLLLGTALRNIIDNALIFTAKGGSVLMTVRTQSDDGDMVTAQIRIEDGGCGMTAEELPMIFNRFYTAPSGHALNRDGKGNGLYEAKNIIELHKGSISVSSEPGKGSCFTIELSTMKADSVILEESGLEEIRRHELSNVWQHKRLPIIMMVESNKDIRDMLLASLGNDYSFIAVDDEEDAIRRIHSEKTDLVVIGLPSGAPRLCKAIRENLSTTFLPIIALGSGHKRSEGYSVDCTLNKPVSMNELNNNIIKLLIKHEQYLDKIRQQQIVTPQIEDIQSEDSRFLKEIWEIINRHIDDPDFNASSLCEQSHWSAKQVYRKLKALTGMTTVEFIREARLSRAELYLTQNHLTINEIMYKVGFTTASYFAKCFKDRYGVTPSEYISSKA